MMLVNMIIYLPLKACQEWGVIIAIQHYKMSPTIGSSLITWHELGGVLSGFVAPVVSDICGGRRTVVVAGCSALAALAFAALQFVGVPEDAVDSGDADNPTAANQLSVAGHVQYVHQF
jgi:sugar phosphate permease